MKKGIRCYDAGHTSSRFPCSHQIGPRFTRLLRAIRRDTQRTRINISSTRLTRTETCNASVTMITTNMIMWLFIHQGLGCIWWLQNQEISSNSIIEMFLFCIYGFLKREVKSVSNIYAKHI